eukprot:3937004-Rhodomonas_salina.3
MGYAGDSDKCAISLTIQHVARCRLRLQDKSRSLPGYAGMYPGTNTAVVVPGPHGPFLQYRDTLPSV